MKKLLVVALLNLFVGETIIAQDTIYVNGVPKITKKKTYEEVHASPLVKDDYLIDLSYGVPFNPVREAGIFGIDLFESTTNSQITRNTNHLCGRVDYQLNEEYGVGLELTYASIQFEYKRLYSVRSGTNIVVRDSAFITTASKIRFLAKMSYHFNISDRFDAYGTVGFGYKQFKYGTRDNYLTTTSFANQILPVAIRASIGGRFFVSKNVAVNVEGGIGGPIMQLGLSFKMHSSPTTTTNRTTNPDYRGK